MQPPTGWPSPDLVRQHLARVLASSQFRTSKRCSEFLSFVVERALEGRSSEIKERTIGVEVFGKSPDYEMTNDPVVRVKANEVRKRLAQYYREEGAAECWQFELPAGSYVPGVSASGPAAKRVPREPRRWWLFAVAGGVAVALLAVAILLRRAPATELDAFWAPALQTTTAPVICLGSSTTWMLTEKLGAELEGAVRTGKPLLVKPGDAVHLQSFHISQGNMEAVVSLAGLLAAKGAPVQIRHGAVLSLDDVAAHTVIAIGAFTNPWTLRRNSELRYAFERPGESETEPMSIVDRREQQRRWTVSERFPWKKQTVDYALVTRLFEPGSGNVFISAAGLNSFGSQVAGEFLTKPSYWTDLIRSAPGGWKKMNLQVVLETTVVGTTPSPPKVLAAYYW